MRRLRASGELESAVMTAIWDAPEPVTVRQVMAEVGRQSSSGPPAYTTIMTVMERLLKKGLLGRAASGRAHLYSPTKSREEHTATLMAEALGTSPNRATTLQFFAAELSAAERSRMKDMLDRP